MYGLEPARFLTRDGQVARGIKQIVTVPNPAAGAELSVAVPGGEQWFIYAGSFVFTASGAVGNRTVSLLLQVDGAQVYKVRDATPLAAGNVFTYSVYMGDSPVPVQSSGGVGMLPLPLIPLPQGSVILTGTSGRDAADQYSAVNLYVARMYLPDQKLDEIAECEQREYFDAMRKAGLTHGA